MNTMSELQEFLTSKVAKQNLELATDRDIWKAEAERMTSGYDAAQAELSDYRDGNMALRDELKTERLRADAAVSDANDAERELAALREELAESDSVVTRVSELLAGVAVAVRGPELELRRHSYHDLPERVQEIQQCLIAAEQRNAELEKNAARYIWLRDHSPFEDGIDIYVWDQRGEKYQESGCYLSAEHLDTAIDAAIKPTESGASE